MRLLPPLALLSLLSPIILLLLSFIFSLIATTSNNWSSSGLYSGDTLSSRTLQATNTRGPYRSAFYSPDLDNPSTYTATYSSGICVEGDEPFFCQQLSVGAHFLVAGCVFTGLSLVVGGVALGLLWGSAGVRDAHRYAGSYGYGSGCQECQRHRHRHHHIQHDHEKPSDSTAAEAAASTNPTPTGQASGKRQHISLLLLRTSRTLTLLFTILSILCLSLGTLITTYVLVNEQRPDGDFIVSGPDTVGQDHWMMERGVTFGFLGWLFTLVAVVLVPSVDPLREACAYGNENGRGRREKEKEAVE